MSESLGSLVDFDPLMPGYGSIFGFEYGDSLGPVTLRGVRVWLWAESMSVSPKLQPDQLGIYWRWVRVQESL